MLGRQFAGQRLNLHDKFWGKRTGGDPVGHVLLDPPGVPQRSVFAIGFTSWTECTVPLHVLLLRDAYADGHQDPWSLMEKADFTDPHQP